MRNIGLMVLTLIAIGTTSRMNAQSLDIQNDRAIREDAIVVEILFVEREAQALPEVDAEESTTEQSTAGAAIEIPITLKMIQQIEPLPTRETGSRGGDGINDMFSENDTPVSSYRLR